MRTTTITRPRTRPMAREPRRPGVRLRRQEVGRYGDLVHDRVRAWGLRGPSSSALVGHDGAVQEELAPPDAPRLGPLQRALEAHLGLRALRADGLGPSDVDDV